MQDDKGFPEGLQDTLKAAFSAAKSMMYVLNDIIDVFQLEIQLTLSVLV